MKILLHGRLADAIGRDIALDVPVATAHTLRQELASRYPQSAATIARSRVVANDRFVEDGQPLGGLVELLPPVSGG